MVVTSTVESMLEERTRRLDVCLRMGIFSNPMAVALRRATAARTPHPQQQPALPLHAQLDQIKARASQLECYTDVREGVCDAGFAIVLFLFS